VPARSKTYAFPKPSAMSLRIVFFGNSENVFSNRHFDALRQTPCDIVAIVDAPPSRRSSTNPAVSAVPSFAAVAEAMGIACHAPEDPNAPEVIQALRQLSPDLFVAAGYTGLLKRDILAVPKLLAANFHASLLPAYRGRSPLFWAIRNGESQSGLTVHVMDEGLDTGDVLYQVRVAIDPNDSVESLYAKVIDASVPLIGRLVADADGNLVRTPQPSAGGSYFSGATEDDFRLDWTQPAETLRRWICATPGKCFLNAQGVRIFADEAEAVSTPADLAAGTVLAVDEAGVCVVTAEGLLRLRRVHVNHNENTEASAVFAELGICVGGSL